MDFVILFLIASLTVSIVANIYQSTSYIKAKEELEKEVEELGKSYSLLQTDFRFYEQRYHQFRSSYEHLLEEHREFMDSLICKD